jgi:lipoprotein-anchoring transpeptidase ErfK/SrfK
MRALAAVIVGAALLAGCDSGATPSSTSTPSTTATSSESGDGVQLYFTAGEQLRPVPDPGDPSGADPEATMRSLLAGPATEAPRDVETEIPNGVEVEHVGVDDRGTATVEVSRRFTRGVPTEPRKRSPNQEAELDARLAQVTYTLAQFDDVERTRLVSGGVPVGGVQGRDDFAKPEPKAPKHRLGEPHPKGNSSASVRALQERLAGLRYLPKGAVDGIDGYRTRQAVTAFQAWEGLQRDGIAGPQTKAALATARRPKPKADGPSKRLEVYRDKGVTLLVKKGRTKRAVHTSSGAPGYTTPAGRFEVFRKEVNSWSVPYQTWLPLASYFNAGIAFHAYPDVPAYPASHGCVRVPEPEAEHLYAFARIGTTVIVR